MAVSLLAQDVSDLCLGKPALRSLSVSATVADALAVLKNSDDNFVSVWSCCHGAGTGLGFGDGDDDDDEKCAGACRCVGKICMVDVICYLCEDEKNLQSPSVALKAPVSVILPKVTGLIVHVEPSCSLLEAIDLIIKGAQNLVVPIQTRPRRKQQYLKPSPTSPTSHNGQEFCWLTHEDVIRFMLSSIGVFSPIPALSIDSLGLISTDVLAVEYYSPASAAVGAISRSLVNQTSVAVVDGEGTLIGEISPYTLACCDETVAAAVATLSAGDLMAYIDCGGPPEDLVRAVKIALKEKELQGMLQYMVAFYYSSSSSSSCSSCSSFSSSDEESPAASTGRSSSGRYSRAMSYSARMMRRSQAIFCHPKSSLMAVMIQAITHRVKYVWVVEEDCSLVGIVTFRPSPPVVNEE